MRILTVYSPEDSGLIRLWQRSWAAHGWKPGLISPKELQGKSWRAAAKARRGRLIAVRAINYGARPRSRWKAVYHGCRGWLTAKVVVFPETFTEDQIIAAREA